MREQLREVQRVAAVRRRMETELGLALPEQRVALGRRTDGSDRQHLFDLVAENRAFVAEVRTYTLGESKTRPAGKFAHCYAACLFLYRARARRKALILTDRDFWSRFRREADGLLEGLEVLYVPDDTSEPVRSALPPDIAVSGAPRVPAEQARPVSGFRSRPTAPVAPRRNKGGPGPGGRRPNTGPRRPR